MEKEDSFNSWEVSFIVSNYRPHVKIGIPSAFNWNNVITYNRRKELLDWAVLGADKDWFKDHI